MSSGSLTSDEPLTSDSTDEPLTSESTDELYLGPSRGTVRAFSYNEPLPSPPFSEPDEPEDEDEDEDDDIGQEVDKSATDEAMHAFKTRAGEWTHGAAHGSADRSSADHHNDAHGSTQGVPYREFLHVKRTVNSMAGSMSNLERNMNNLGRNMDRLAKSLESLERSNANASCNQSRQPPAPFPNFPERRTGIPNRREADELFVKRRVRAYLKDLIPKHLQLIPAVSEQERNEYAAKIASGSCNEEAVTLDNYRIDLGSTPTSAWNQSAGRVFVAYFADKSGLSLRDHPGLYPMIISAFSIHLTSLRDTYRYSLASAYKKTGRRRSTRTNKLFQVRLHTVATHPYLQPHLDMIKRFGVGGTSDDESDRDDPINPRYDIRRLPWLSLEATNWKRTIDKVGTLTKYQGSLLRRGERQRTVSGKRSTRQYIPGLPLNAYDKDWLDQDPMRPTLVRATANYDFAHDPKIMSYVLHPT